MKIIRTAALAVLCATFAFAQEYRATILGQVTDPSGAGIPNATVKATRVDTHVSTEVKASSNGVYSIPFLNPGTYDVEASAPGFAALKRENIVLLTADKLNLPLKLQVGQINQEVTVVGQQEVINTGDASRGLNFDEIKTQEYPLNGRQTYMLLALTPGVIFTQEAFGATGFSGTRGWDVNSSYMINGGRTGTSQFLLNGAPISDKGGSWQLAPNVEAVQEFKVMTNTYDAQYGRFTGGVVNTTLKSGTNGWHGDVFEYFRNRVFDANLVQNNRIGAGKGAHNQHQFGGVVGGPIRKDKDFVFYSQESWREITPFGKVSNVPVLDLRDGQHFDEFNIQIFNPYSSHLCNSKTEPCGGTIQPGGASTYIRDPFPENKIPQSMISPVAQKILSFYPAPNTSGLQQNFTAPANTGHYHYNQPMGRWDHIFGPNDRFYALVTYQHGYEFRNSTGFPPPIAEGEIFSQRTDQNYIASWTHVMGPNKVLDVRASLGRFTSIFPRISDYSATPQKTLGMTNMIHAPSVTFNVLPTFTMDDYTRFANNTIDWSTYNQLNIAPTLAITKSRHSLHFGFDFMYTAKGDSSTGNANGQFNFNRNQSRQLSSRSQGSKDGDPVASLLLGLPDGGGIDYRDKFYRTRPYYAFFVQDDWKISEHLTLNLGLRYDLNIPWLERYNRLNAGFAATTVNPNSDAIIANWIKLKAAYDANPTGKYPYPDPPKAIYGGLLFAGKNGQPRRTYDTDWTNIAPRIGIAWQLTPKTVLRAGGGLFYRAQTQENTTTGFTQTTSYKNSLDGITPSAKSVNGAYSLVDPFPDGLLPVAGSSLGLLTNIGNGISYDSRKVPMPRSYQYSFGIQRELPGSIVAEVSYTGNYSVHDTYGLAIDDAGALTPLALSYRAQAIADTLFYDQQLQNPLFGVVPTNVSFGNATIRRENLLRPYPEFNGVTANTIPKVHYRYDALQVGIQKRAFSSKNAGVLTFVLSYTFSKGFEQNHRLIYRAAHLRTRQPGQAAEHRVLGCLGPPVRKRAQIRQRRQ